MIEYIKAFSLSIWEWVVTNRDSISTFILSGQFASLVGALILLIRQIRQVKSNTSSTNMLNQTLTNTNTMSTSVRELDDNFRLLKSENDALRTELSETEDRLQAANNEIMNKLNAIIEVQSIVYSTIRDDSVRQTVNTILNNARYSEKNFKQELETQIETLKNTYENEMAILTKKVSDSVSEMSDLLKAGEQAKIAMKKRVDENASVRY